MAAPADWTAFLLEGTATAVGAAVTLVSVVVGARIYREGVKDRPVDPSRTVTEAPTSPDSAPNVVLPASEENDALD